MSSKSNKHSMVAGAIEGVVAAGTLILSSTFVVALAFPQPGYAQTAQITGDTGTWKIDVAKSRFGPDYNTLVLQRAGTGKTSSDGSSSASTFIVISNGKVYLTNAAEAYEATGAKKIDYTRWRNMKFVQVGEMVRSLDHCGFRCQSGVPENQLTLSFKSINGGMPDMHNVVVYNKR